MSVDALTRDRMLRLAGIELRGKPHPGQRYRHGWIPVLGKLMGGSNGGPEVPSPAPAKRPQRDWSAPRGRGAARGEEIRPELASAATASDVGRATTAEARRLTGRDIPFDLDGADVGIARDYAEGILRGLERFPEARLHSVRVGDAGERSRGGGGVVDTHIYAATREHDDRTYEIIFDRDWSSRPDEYRAELAEDGKRRRMGRGHVTDSPMGSAIHEFGHVVANGSGLNGAARTTAGDWLDDHGHEHYHGDDAEERYGADARRSLALGEDVSRYATNSERELAAEAFADVMTNGDEAGEISRHIFDEFEDRLARRT